MSRSSRTIRLLLACVLILGLTPQGFGWTGIAHASVILPTDSGGGSVTMAVYQIDDTSHTVTSVVYSNPQGDLVSKALTGHIEVYIQSAVAIGSQDVSVDPRFNFTPEQLSPNVVVLRDFQDTYSSGSFKTLINVNQGGITKQLFFARMNSGDSLFKFAASEQGVPLTIRSYTLTNLDSSYFYPDTLMSISGSLYMSLPYGTYSMQLNAGPSGTTSYVRAYRVSQFVDSATEGKLTVIPLNADERSWSAVKAKITALDGSSLVGADQVLRLKRSFYPANGTEPYTFGGETEISTQPSSTTYSPDYAVPITYYMDSGTVTSYDLVAQIDRHVPDTSRYESFLAYSSQVPATPGTLFDWQISTGNLSKLVMNYKPTVANSNPFPTSLSACLNYSPTAPYSPLACYPEFGIGVPPTTFGNGYQMVLPIGASGTGVQGLSTLYIPKNFQINSFFYSVTTNDGGANYANMTFMKTGEEFTSLVKNAANDPAGATIDVGGKLSDIRTDYNPDSRTVIAYLVNEAGDRLINADNYNNTEGNAFPANIHYELAENPGASETKYQLYGMYPQQSLSSDVRLENVQIRFLGFERNGASLNYDILATPASASTPWVTNFPIIVSLSSTAALNVPPGQFIYAVSDTNQVRIFGIDSLGESAIGYLPTGHWQFRTVQANQGAGTSIFDFFNIVRSFIQVGKAETNWPVAAKGTVVSLPVVVLSKDSSGNPRPLDIADIATFAKKIGTGTAWDINQDGQPLNKSDIQYLLQALKQRWFFSSPTGNTAGTLNQLR